MVSHALVNSWLNYCNILYVVQPLKTTWKLLPIQTNDSCLAGVTLVTSGFPSSIQGTGHYL